MLQNKHVTTALLIAPILALIAYFATDNIVSEKPKPVISGSNHTLSAASNCRYQSGRCTLKNHDVKAEITFPKNNAISISSNIPLHTAEIRIISSNKEQENPARISLTNTDRQRMTWFSKLPHKAEAKQTLQVVIDTGNARFFHETKMTFIDIEGTTNH